MYTSHTFLSVYCVCIISGFTCCMFLHQLCSSAVSELAKRKSKYSVLLNIAVLLILWQCLVAPTTVSYSYCAQMYLNASFYYIRPLYTAGVTLPKNTTRTIYLADDLNEQEKKDWVDSLNENEVVYLSGRKKRYWEEINPKSALVNWVLRQLYPDSDRQGIISLKEVRYTGRYGWKLTRVTSVVVCVGCKNVYW